MKKLIALILALALALPVVSLAEFDIMSMLDLSTLSDETLKNLISMCSAELQTRHKVDPEGIILLDQNGVTIYQTGDAAISSITGAITVPITIVNTLDKRIMVNIDDILCNGWNCSGICGSSMLPNSKSKDNMYIDVSDAEIKTLDDVTSLTFRWSIFSVDDISYPYKQETPEEHRFW